MPVIGASRNFDAARVYTRSFFSQVERESRAAAEAVVPIAMRLFSPRSALDVGCGVGEWLSAFQRAGVAHVRGMDGQWVDRSRIAIAQEDFTTVELAGEWSVAVKYDIAICLEVAEHLPARCARTLVARLTTAAPAVLFSAAVPGQGGTNHINEQWPEYWEALFAEIGYLCIDPFRRHIWQDSRVAWYYQQNLVAYVHPDLMERRADLQEERARRQNCPVTLIHPKIMRPMKRPQSAIKLLPTLLMTSLRRALRNDRLQSRDDSQALLE